MRSVLPSLIIMVLLGAGILAAQEKVTVVTPGLDHPYAQAIKIILTEAYRELGMELVLEQYPPNRCERMFDAGEIDGQLFSDDYFLKSHPGAMKIDVPLATDEFVVFTKEKELVVDGWQSLKKLRIGYMHGMFVVEENIRGMESDGSQNPLQAFRKLAAGRTDIVVFPRIIGESVLKTENIKGIRYLSPPLARIPLYYFVTPRQKYLAKKLSAVLEKMERNGRIKELILQAESELPR